MNELDDEKACQESIHHEDMAVSQGSAREDALRENVGLQEYLEAQKSGIKLVRFLVCVLFG